MQWVALGLLAAAGAAGVAVLGRVGLQRVDTVMATTLRSIVMTVMLVAVAGLRGGARELVAGPLGLDSRAWAFVIGAGMCGAISWLAYFAARCCDRCFGRDGLGNRPDRGPRSDVLRAVLPSGASPARRPGRRGPWHESTAIGASTTWSSGRRT